IMLLLDESSAPEPARARVPLLDDADAWKRLPPAEVGAGGPLPNWARALAASLPRTTAAMLELDYKHRAHSPLDPKLRGLLRRVAAVANHCDYTRATAEADLRRAGLDDAAWNDLSGERAGLSDDERAALAFARKLTLAADTVTDDEVARLMAAFGEKQVAAMVLLLAHANFQDRLILALGVPIEAGGPLAPREIRFVRGSTAPSVPPRRRPEGRPAPTAPERVDDPDWRALDFD